MSMRTKLEKQLLVSCIISAATVLGACASGYGEATITGGFREERLGPMEYWINFSGNGYTSHETTQTYWLHRAASATLENGFDGFKILTPIKLSALPPSTELALAVNPSERVKFQKIVEVGNDGKPYLSARIRFLKAPFEEDGSTVFDARRLKTFLDPYVKSKLCGSNVCPHVHKYLFPNYGDPIPPRQIPTNNPAGQRET